MMEWKAFATAAGLFASASPAAAAVNFVKAQAGLQAMSELNLIVLDNMTGGHDIEGKTFVGGNLSGNSTTFGIGNGSQGAAPSSRRTLTVGGNLTAGFNLNNGSNGGSGQVATTPGLLVGGNVGSGNINAPGAAIDIGGNFGGNLNLSNGQTVNIGGSATGNINGSNNTQTVRAGGSINGNANGANFIANQGLGWNAASTSQAVAAERLTLIDSFSHLSAALGGLTLGTNPSSITAGGQGPIFNAVKGTNAFALFNISAGLLAQNEINFNVTGGAFPIIVNVTGATVTWNANPVGGYNAGLNRSIIWNFLDATSISFQKMVHGSILAPRATISNTTPLEGSIVARNFNQGGEVHLGTFGHGGFAPIPEPASWAMMIAGFGFVGGTLRRRRASVRFA